MAGYIDYTLNNGAEGLYTKYTDTNALVLAIKNLLLSRPGNFPLHPSFGMDIGKYQFEIADETTVANIQTELNTQIAKYIPSVSDVDAKVRLIEYDENHNGHIQMCLAISVSAATEDDRFTTNFVVINEKGLLRVINETY